jgi:hypothetical protein
MLLRKLYKLLPDYTASHSAFICFSFNNAVTSSDYIVLTEWVTEVNEFQNIATYLGCVSIDGVWIRYWFH